MSDLKEYSLKQGSMSILEEYEFLYNAIEKEIRKLKEGKRWRARYNEKYYFFHSDGAIDASCERGYRIDTDRYNLGNYFQARGEVEKAVEKIEIYTKLKDLALRLNKGEEIDWEDYRQYKYYIYYDYDSNRLACACTLSLRDIGQIYCLDEKFLEKAKKEIGEESLKKLFE